MKCEACRSASIDGQLAISIDFFYIMSTKNIYFPVCDFCWKG